MESAWGISRKSTRDHSGPSSTEAGAGAGTGAGTGTGAGGLKLVQLQRHIPALSRGLPTLLTISSSTISSGPLSSSAHGSGVIHPRLSAFLTSPSTTFESSSTGSSNNYNHSISQYAGGIESESAPTTHGALSNLGSFAGGNGELGKGSSGEELHASSKSTTTSLSTSTPTLSSGNVLLHIPGSSETHPLHYNWVFWFMHRAPGSKILNYESSMKKITTFGSVEAFWAVYSHLRRPNELPHVSDYHLFKQGVRPVWEDPANISGGKWIVRLKKGLASRYWENLAMAVIGDQFDVGSEICGIVLSIRGAEDILSIWNKSADEGRINLKIRDTMKRVLDLPIDTVMEYKSHNDALKDNTSFRNTDIFR
ncbi:Eukaryotic translation initiation factor 4E type 2 [Lobosporangium transversale]|uniref:Translation initiation factor eIF 4e-like domain-containing protein n=1 Tax=Lobosporangium transversale TaxID=64571 RepID=A0A1Y2GVJ1_9FUNG|nr:translation initiation factor eIF 4e-like domain-containing protein [Lobosporangium transversale]KAF9918526.1 Eukaryotic translation initiation factor 4E type 2 [Lobosporangium transversale]ORZ20069.1 translation initiation factor eIF 4e-like domain-containing protein [Lobosporangium transversale]|eukprot:XP_021882609.1 translation initiation factor eIF 4e-like domain-containing protein [Lobosporangium transversale]